MTISNLSGLPKLFRHELKLLKPYLTFLKPGSPRGMDLGLSNLIGVTADSRARRARAVVYKGS